MQKKLLTLKQEYKLLLDCGWPEEKIKKTLGTKARLTKCFSCNSPKTQKLNRGYSFCRKCYQRYFFRKTGTPIEGMDFTRQIVRIRDQHTCQKKHGGCGKKWRFGRRRFDVHHLNGVCGRNSRSYDKISELPKLTTLCHKCHLNLKEVKKKMSKKSSPRPMKDKLRQAKWNKDNLGIILKY